ncbi:MAG: MaoC/PaaZ C-terminal domain-containing protein, partial [Gammaproteobacteria bacterium]|nr:MaoC/PaaZ C-terminal domain-containing protein [Gammaproteobacteria bacterium]
MSNLINASQLQDYVGKEVGLTDWIEVDQERINQFADATGDHQYIHL